MTQLAIQGAAITPDQVTPPPAPPPPSWRGALRDLATSPATVIVLVLGNI